MTTGIDRRMALVAIAAAMLSACGGGDEPPPAVGATPPPPMPGPDAPLEFAPGELVPGAVAALWSAVATQALQQESDMQAGRFLPVEQPRVLRAAFWSAFDVGAGIVAQLRPSGHYSNWSVNPEAAMGAAMHRVLRSLLPGQAAYLDAALAAAMAAVPDGSAKQLGTAHGQQAALRAIDWAAADGTANAEAPYVAGDAAGIYQATDGALPRFVNWSQVRTEILTNGSQFRPPPPPALTDPRYLSSLDEVKSLGGVDSAGRTDEQSEIAQFWQQSTPLAWQRVAVDVLARARLGGIPDSEATVLFQVYAGLQGALGDAYIAALDSNYFYRFWRPITAIRAVDPTWQPFGGSTPPTPEYVCAEALVSMVAGLYISGHSDASRITDIRCSSVTLPGVTRQFLNLQDMATEVGLSRLYAGHNFRHSVQAAWDLAQRIATYVPPE